MPLLTKPRHLGTASAVATPTGPAQDRLDFMHVGSQEQITPDERRRIREANIKAMVRGTLRLKHTSLLAEVYDVDSLPDSLTRSFQPPVAPPEAREEAFRRKTLGPRKKWDQTLLAAEPRLEGSAQQAKGEGEDSTPFEPLVLWTPHTDAPESDNWAESVAVDEILCRKLRPHQREGTQFLFQCLMNEPAGDEGPDPCDPPNRMFRAYKGQGCILADDMGLGKTLQSITILHTLLRQGFRKGESAVKKALVVCPTSLVGNWESEIHKWLRHKPRAPRALTRKASSTYVRDARHSGQAPHTLTLGSIEPVEAQRRVHMYKAQQRSSGMVLILSYEMARKYVEDLVQARPGLVICDEAHRLKNDKTATAAALDRLPTPRRVLLSGTPVQNDLGEFFAMVNFCNPGVLGDEARFSRDYARPVLRGREPDATEAQQKAGEERGQALGAFCHLFILRRTNTILSKLLPPKVVQVVCVGLSDLQRQLYDHFLDSKRVRAVLSKNNQALPAITLLKKLCNHPVLIREASSSQVAGYEECLSFFPPDYGRARDGSRPDTSGKLLLLVRLLLKVKSDSDDRFVLVSNYTSMLDVFQLMAREHGWTYVRLDGSTSQKKRTALVQQFNEPGGPFLFLLSSKAGGCGLNLVGGNRLVLFDPDWNPANDKQAAARVWRDGQKKRVFIYRFVTAGTIEEFVYERQLSKEGLAGVASNEQVVASALSSAELRDLFTRHEGSRSHFHDKLRCDRCSKMLEERAGETRGLCVPQVGRPKETDGLEAWAHHHGCDTVDDAAMAEAGAGLVSFIFSLHVDGKDKDATDASAEAPEADGEEGKAPKAPVAGAAEAPAGTRGADGKENFALVTAEARRAAGAVGDTRRASRTGGGSTGAPVGRAGLAGTRHAAPASAQRSLPPRAKRARTCAGGASGKRGRRGSDTSSSDDEEDVEEEEEEESEDEQGTPTISSAEEDDDSEGNSET